MSVPCPECGIEIHLPEDTFLNEIIECDACGAELKIVSIAPLSVEPFEEEEK